MKRNTIHNSLFVIYLVIIAFMTTSCAVLNNAVGKSIQKPQVSFVNAELDSLSFEAARLVFDLRVKNPNSVGLNLKGFDYNLLINGSSFLKGKQQKGLRIKANDVATIQFPVSLSYTQLYNTFEGLKKQDRSMYQMKCGFAFEVPVLGVVNIPVSKSGELPLLKLPQIGIRDLKLRKIGFSGAELALGIRLNNPNAFTVILERFKYNFDVNGLNWASGNMTSGIQVPEKGESIVEIPISLNFIKMGRSVYDLLKGENDVNYRLGGILDLNTSVPILGKVALPFDRSGSVKITR